MGARGQTRVYWGNIMLAVRGHTYKWIGLPKTRRCLLEGSWRCTGCVRQRCVGCFWVMDTEMGARRWIEDVGGYNLRGWWRVSLLALVLPPGLTLPETTLFLTLMWPIDEPPSFVSDNSTIYERASKMGFNRSYRITLTLTGVVVLTSCFTW